MSYKGFCEISYNNFAKFGGISLKYFAKLCKKHLVKFLKNSFWEIS
jgi:hypothetical protein